MVNLLENEYPDGNLHTVGAPPTLPQTTEGRSAPMEMLGGVAGVGGSEECPQACVERGKGQPP